MAAKVLEVNAELCRLCKELSVAQINVQEKYQSVRALLETCSPNTDLDAFLSLCVSKNDQARALALKLTKEIPDHFHEEILRFAVDSWSKTSKSGTVSNQVSKTALFYHIFTFEECFSQFLIPYFLECSPAMRTDVLSQIARILQTEQIGPEIVRQCFEKSQAIDLLIFIVTQQSLVTSLTPEICEILKSEFEKQKDVRFLIPVIPSMKPHEFLADFDGFLEISDAALLRTFAFEILYARSRPLEIYDFLAQLHKYTDTKDKKYQNSVLVFNFCLDQKQVVTMRDLCSAMDRVAKTESFLMLFDSINKILKVYPETNRIIGGRILGTMIARDLDTMPESWNGLKKLIFETSSYSCACALKLPFDLFEDLIKTYPELKHDFRDFLKARGSDGINEEFKQIIDS
jgi:hypothetical protein